MTQSLKIECLVTDLTLEGEVASFLVTKEQLTAGLSKKADLVEGKIQESNLPNFIANSFQTINQKLVTLEESISDGIQSAKDYSEAYTNEKLIAKADLVDGRVPQTQLPSVGQYEGLSDALNGVLDQARRDMIERTDEIQRVKADLGEDGKVVREQLPNYDKIPGLETVVRDLYDNKVDAAEVFLKSETLDIAGVEATVERIAPTRTEVDTALMMSEVVQVHGFEQKYIDAGGYPFGAVLTLDDGVTKVESTVANNKNNPNSNVVGWKFIKTKFSQVIDENGFTALEISRGVVSVAELLNLNVTVDGTRVYVHSYHSGWGTESPYIGPRGGGYFIYKAANKLINNGVTIFNGWTRVDTSQITPEMGGAYGTGKVSDANSIQLCLNHCKTLKRVLHCDNKYLIDQQITGDSISGITSNNRGTFIIGADITPFKFSGWEMSKWFERINFEYNVATVLNNATVEFNFVYHVMGVKFRDNLFNGKAGQGWTGLRITGTAGRGFFGGFEFCNNQSYNMYADIHFAAGSFFANSGMIQNNFKFYGTYGILIDVGASINNILMKNYQAQECSGNTIRANGGMGKCGMELIYNWDNFNPGIYLGPNTSMNNISLTYLHDIVDYGFANEIDSKNLLLATDTAIASDIYEETSRSTEASFRTLFNQFVNTGNTQKAEGVNNEIGSGLSHSGLMLYAAPAVPLVEGQTDTNINQNGYFLLDNQNTQISVLGTKFYGKYERYSTLRMQVDFEILSSVMDDGSFTIAIGEGASAAKPTRYFGLVVQEGELCIIQQTSDVARTVLAKMGVPKKGRYLLQLRSGNRQSIGIQAVYLNGVKVAEVTLDLVGSKRPFIELKASTNPVFISLLGCKLRNWISQGFVKVIATRP